MKYSLFVLFTLLFATLFGQDLSVESIWKDYSFSAKRVQGFRSMNDGKHYTRMVKENDALLIKKYQFENYNGDGSLLLNLSSLNFKGANIQVQDYQFNADESKILLLTNRQKIYRRSYTANYYIYDLKTNQIQSLSEENKAQRLATFSPDGQKIAYLYENNIFMYVIESGKTIQITKDGKTNSIINGGTDWVYEEEFAITQGFSWSFNSEKIAFLKFDESEVKSYHLSYYGKLYPEQYTYKYPKAGEDNSKVSMHIYDMKTAQIEKLNLGEYEYIPRFKWSPVDEKLVVLTLNRHQNELKYHLVSTSENQNSDQIIFTENSNSYVEIDHNLEILNDGKSLIRTSEADGYNHIYQLFFDGQQKQITSGKWDVIDTYGLDSKEKSIYFSAAKHSAISKGIYKATLKKGEISQLTEETGYHDARFSKGMKYFIETSSNATTPPSYYLCSEKGKLQTLEDNQELIEKLNKLSLGEKRFMKVKGAEGDLNAYTITPPSFDSLKSHPLYMFVYGGPGSNKVLDRWDGAQYMYLQLLASKGYVVLCVDPRGTMFQGAAFKKSTYMNLGKLELEDFVAVAKEMGNKRYIDFNRIGIQGWSYGGFMSTLAMTKGEGVFKAGIAVAPVTNWRFYDNIYTERFMRTPKENANGYDHNSPLNYADKLNGNYLIIHGSGDDNVHHQNAMEMVNALIAADKDFDFFIYPNRDHGIYGNNARNHIFRKMLKFTLENL